MLNGYDSSLSTINWIIRPIMILIFFVLFLLYIYQINKTYNTFQLRGLFGPTPRLFFGNLIELYTHKWHSAACLADWTQQYGKIYGYFIGRTPIICVSDPDILKEIFITKFAYFNSRRPLPLERHDLQHLLTVTGN